MASPLQTMRAIEAALKAATWGTSPATVVLGDADMITAGFTEEAQVPGRLPFALLNLGEGRPDATDPNLLEQDFTLVLAAAVPGHDLGKFHLTGGSSSKTPRSAYSENRGLLEIETPVLAAVRSLTGADGAPILVSWSSAAQVQAVAGRDAVWRQYTLRAVCTSDEEWPAPQNLVATGGAGEIALTWDLPAARYDLDSIIVRYTSGATAPASASAGTPVTLASDLDTSVTIPGLAADTYSVAVFARYQPYNSGDVFDSEQETGTTRLSVTVS